MFTKSLEDDDTVAIDDVYFGLGEYGCAVGVAETSDTDAVVDKRFHDVTMVCPWWNDGSCSLALHVDNSVVPSEILTIVGGVL